MNDHRTAPRTLARRTLLTSAGLGLGAGLVSGLAPAQAAAPETANIWSHDYWAQKGDVKLYMFRKRLGEPAAAAAPLPVLFLVHGSSLSALSSYDLTVRGSQYSLMDVFAGYGFDVWTMDHEGYGRSSQTSGNSDIASGVADLKAAAEVVQRETGRSNFHVFGESSGAIRAGAFAQSAPERVDRLILTAFTYKGEGAAEIARRQQHVDELRANPRRKRDAEMIRSIFSRDGHPTIYDPAV